MTKTGIKTSLLRKIMERNHENISLGLGDCLKGNKKDLKMTKATQQQTLPSPGLLQRNCATVTRVATFSIKRELAPVPLDTYFFQEK